MLSFTEMNSNEIANAVGIDNQYYFSKTFKKVERTSIREYRRQWKSSS